jgi:DNA-binding transcriptional regulator YhcF (GntR family)
MAEVKHTEITRILEEKILSRHYQDRLPPVRELVREFDTSVRTMTKAIKPLSEAGLVVPTSNGTRICLSSPRRKRTGVVNIVYRWVSERRSQHDILLDDLKKLVAAAGCKSVLMEVSDAEIFNDVEFWKSARVDGHIFVYSSFYNLLSRHLTLHNIPFVVGNWMPINYGVHWVDFNNEQMMYLLVEQIVRQTGNHRIAFTFPGSVSTGQHWLKERWGAIAAHFDLPDYTGSGLCFSKDLEGAAREWAALPAPPEIIISNHQNVRVLRESFEAKNLPLQLVLRSDVGEDTAAWRYSGADYHLLAKEIWTVFEQVVDGTAGRPRSHLVDFNPKINFDLT